MRGEGAENQAKSPHNSHTLSLVEPQGKAEPQPELGSSFCFSLSGAKEIASGYFEYFLPSFLACLFT